MHRELASTLPMTRICITLILYYRRNATKAVFTTIVIPFQDRLTAETHVTITNTVRTSSMFRPVSKGLS
jgi:hypothetical protein